MKKRKLRIQWRENGKRFSKTFATVSEAKAFKARRKCDVDRASSDADMLTFADLANLWLYDYCALERSEGQFTVQSRTISKHFLPRFGQVPLAELNRIHLQELKTELVREGRKPRTINVYLTLARQILQAAVEWEVLTVNPFVKVKNLKQGPREFSYWSPAERDKFLRFCRHHDPDFHRLCLVACHTGMRCAELRALQRGEIDFERGRIMVSSTFRAVTGQRHHGAKNGRCEEIPMNSLVAKTLADLKLAPADMPAFKPFSLCSAAPKVKRLAKLAGVREITFHDLRHTFASCLAMAGLQIQTIKELCRHSNISETLRYAHLSPDYLQGQTEVLVSPTLAPKAPLAVVSNDEH